jgi:hypothetical protein
MRVASSCPIAHKPSASQSSTAFPLRTRYSAFLCEKGAACCFALQLELHVQPVPQARLARAAGPQVLEGPNGGQAVGWPAYHASSVHASPLLYDIDFDGVRDILLATYDGQILFFKDTVRA